MSGYQHGNRSASPLSFPRMNIKTDCSPKRLRKYHDRLETHRTSRSRVATPDCSIDLNRIVRGKGSFTNRQNPYKHSINSIWATTKGSIRRTDNKTSKESIDPAHDQRLGYHHRHVPLHHAHHTLHGCWICHWIASWFASILQVFQECSIFICGYKELPSRSEGHRRDGGGIRAEVDSPKERPLFS